MTNLRQKLNSQSGASIVIALVFFLVCLTVGGVVLTAATASAGRIARIEDEQQAYFAVRSAAELLRDEFEGVTYQASFEEHAGGETGSGRIAPPTSELTAQSANLTELMTKLKAQSADVFLNETSRQPEGADTTLDLPITADGFEQVDAQYAFGADYGVVITLQTASQQYPMTLTITPQIKRETNTRTEKWTTTHTRTDENGVQSSYTVTHRESIRRTTVQVVWTGGTITKGVDEDAP